MKRRDLLRKTGTGLAVGISATGLVGAVTDEQSDAFAPEPEALRAALGRQRDLLGELAADGVLDRTDLDQFDLETRVDAAGEDGVELRKGHVGGSLMDLPVVSHGLDDGHLTVHFMPDGQQAFAVVRDEDGEALETYGGYQQDVGTNVDCPACYEEVCYCDDDPCGWECCAETCYCTCTCSPCPEP